MKNTGDIDAVFYYVQSQSLFGQQFDFTPAEGIIKPGGYQAIQVLSQLNRLCICTCEYSSKNHVSGLLYWMNQKQWTVSSHLF